jgi:phage gpG-like protein
MITLNWLQGPEQLAARLNGTRIRAANALATQLYISMGNLREYIVGSKLSGQVLRHRTGNLINSIFPSVEQSLDQSKLTGKVLVDNTAPYGRYHEYGAHIPERVPIRAKAMHWMNGGKDVFAMRARAFDLPARSFMRSSLKEKRQEIITALATALNRAVNR